MKKRIFLEMYLKKNLGDDIFLRIISERYPDTYFYTKASNKYLKDFSADNIRGASFLWRTINKVFWKLCGWGNYSERKCAAKVILGGSMFIEKDKDEEKLKNELAAKYAKDKPLFVLGANFGPYKNQFYHDKYEQLFSGARDVCFRDKNSANLFKELKNVRVAPDIIFGLDISKYKISQEKKVIISVINLVGRPELESNLDAYENKIADIANMYHEQGYEVVLMSFCKKEGDDEAVKRIIDKVGYAVKPFYYAGNIDNALEQIASSEVVIGTRFHSIVLGLVFGKKVLPIVYSDKTKNMLNDIGFNKEIVPVEKISEIQVSGLESRLAEYDNIEKIQKEASAHFLKLDSFIKGEDNGI